MVDKKSILYGILAGLGLFSLYILIVSFFQGFQFAILNFKSLWFWIIPLVAGFGTQIGLYTSIKHTAEMTGTVAVSGTISGGSMLACCSHFLLNIIPVVGFSGIAIFLVKYQTVFFGIGIISNIIGIGFLFNHKRKMKGGCHSE
ncbi:MAG: hypothetical protein WDZ77_03020 [Candidatus Pacearchaeota archaeon]